MRKADFVMEKKLGVEIEFTGVTRKAVVTALENLFHNTAEEVESKTAEDKYKYNRIKDTNGDTWLVVRDRSIDPQAYCFSDGKLDELNRFKIVDLNKEVYSDYMVELVSPALTSRSLPLLFTVVDVIKALGGITNSSCGIHVHIDKPDNFEDIVTLFKRFCLEQENIFSLFKVEDRRLDRYCKPYDISLLPKQDFESESDFLNTLLDVYAKREVSTSHIIRRTLRYHALNFYSIFQHDTIEFRLFNSTLNRVEIAKMLDWVLHFVYTSEDYQSYIPVLGGILMNELKEKN